MAAVTIRNLADETHRAIKTRAKANGRSAEAEMRAILDEAVRPADSLKLGTELAKIGKEFAEELAMIDFDALRDRTPRGIVDFSGPEYAEYDRPGLK